MKQNLSNLFIIGTDTEVGKTVITCAILSKHKNTLGIKPISSGATIINNQLKNSDALSIIKHNSFALPYSSINPWCFQSAVSPHIAAKEHGATIKSNEVSAFINNTQKKHRDKFIICEGAGGVCCPINDDENFLDILAQTNWPALLVVGLKLGCLNHTQLTTTSLNIAKIKIHGWISNEIKPMQAKHENITTLQKIIKAPHLGDIPYQKDLKIENIANLIKI